MTTFVRAAAALTLALAALPWSAAQAQDIKSRSVKFAFQNQKEHPQGQGAQKFADLVASKSGKKISVKLFAGGVLGGDLQTVSALQGGTLEMTVLNAGLLNAQVKEFGVFDLPFLFASEQEAEAVVDGAFGKKLLAKLDDRGLVGLGFWNLGFRNLTNSKHAVTKLEDVAGLKTRVVQAPIYLDLFNALGANAVPMPFPELYTALEQKAVDGQENPVTVIASSKFYEVQKYLTMTRHTYNPQALIVSKKLWDQLSVDERKVFTEAAAEATAYQRQVAREQESKALDVLKKGGLQITELAPAEVARFRAKAAPVIEKHAQLIGPPVVAELQGEIDKQRKAKP